MWVSISSPPSVTMKSRSPKRTCVLRAQLIAWVAIRGLVWNAQAPYLACQLSVFRVTTNESISSIACLAQMVCLEDTRFILVQAECPYIQFIAAARVTSTESL